MTDRQKAELKRNRNNERRFLFILDAQPVSAQDLRDAFPAQFIGRSSVYSWLADQVKRGTLVRSGKTYRLSTKFVL